MLAESVVGDLVLRDDPIETGPFAKALGFVLVALSVEAHTPVAGTLRLQEEAFDQGADNPLRVIEAFVDELDLGAAGFAHVVPKATGRPGYGPADLLKLPIYGYLNRVRSSRRLEAETHRTQAYVHEATRTGPIYALSAKGSPRSGGAAEEWRGA